MKKQIFWDNCPGKPGWKYPEDQGKSGSCMYREDDFVYFEFVNFDHEDQREYTYTGKFSVDDYKKAIEKLQQTNKVELNECVNPDREVEHPVVPNSLIMVLRDGIVNLTFFGSPSPSSTPGGTRLSGSIPSHCELVKMILED